MENSHVPLVAAIYLAAGAAGAYLVADDFQWLIGGMTFDLGALAAGNRAHFYRPTATLWFAGATRVCDGAAGCYHVLNIALHALNVALVAAIVRRLIGRGTIAFAAALLFGLNPAFVQAVAWVSAATGLLSALGMLLATWLLITSWHAAAGQRRWRQTGAVVAFLGAVFAHEAAAVWPAVAFVLWRLLGPRDVPWRGFAAGVAGVIAIFAATAIVANRENYVFREGIYTTGTHMVRNAFDYLVSLWVGPHRLWAYVLTVPLLALFALTPLSRVGLAWTLLTLLPYLGFTWANAGRYTYLPAIGFAIGVAGLLHAVTRDSSSPAAALRRRTIVWIVAALVVVRFGIFTARGAHGDFASFEPPRTYLLEIERQGRVPKDGVIHVPPPADPRIDRQYVEVMVQWHFRDPWLRVVID